MIEIRRNLKVKEDDLYPYSYFYNGRLINNQGYRKENGLYWNDDPADIKLIEIFKLKTSEFPEMGLFILKKISDNNFFEIENFQKSGNILELRPCK